tara:strand:+ start:32651 stop:34078 length:1428 start_codon:yes stop_codon:yes gene_type:complete
VYFRDNNYNDGIDKFMVITVATENNRNLDRFRESCHYYNIPYKILGLGQEWNGGKAKDGVLLQPGGAQKINLLRKELDSYPDLDNHIILFTDSYDVFFNDDSKSIVKKFREMGSNIVFSAEKVCWPDDNLKDKYPNSLTDYKYLNSGGFIGYGSHIIKLINKVEVSDDYDDQLYYTERYFENLKDEKTIILDHKQFLFQTLSESIDDIKVKDKRVVNMVTNEYPSIIHGNGGTYAKNYLNDLYIKIFGTQNIKSKIDIITPEYNLDSYITIGLFLDEKKLDINQTFDHIRFLNYPKDKISLHVYYQNKKHEYKVNIFNDKYGKLFKEFKVIEHSNGEIYSRKDFLINSYGESDYVVIMESNHIFRNNKSLQILLNECENIITPMMCEEGTDWVNFSHTPLEKNEYKTYIKKGVWNVEYLYGIHIIKNDTIPDCVNSLYNNVNYVDNEWDMLLCDNLKKKEYNLQISNTNYYGGII